MSSISDLVEMSGLSPYLGSKDYDWGQVEEAIGSSLPGDYKILSSACQGFRVDSINLHPPIEEGGFMGILQATHDDMEIMADLYDVELGKTEVPARKRGVALSSHGDAFCFHPTRPGLLCWGRDGIGGSYYWFTEGGPDEWTVVTYARDGWWDAHEMSMSDYLFGIANGSLVSDVPPKRFKDWEMFGWNA